MASLHSLALHSTLFLSNGDEVVLTEMEEKKLNDDDTATIGSATIGSATTTSAASVGTEARTSRSKYLQHRLNKRHGSSDRLKRRFSASNLAEESVEVGTDNQDDVKKGASAVVSTALPNAVQSETESEERRGNTRKSTQNKLDRMNRIQRSRSATMARPADLPLTKQQHQQPTIVIQSKATTRSLSIPRERKLKELRSHSATRSGKVCVAASIADTLKVGKKKEQATVTGNPDTQVPKFLQKKIAKMRQSDNYKKRLHSSNSTEMDSTNIRPFADIDSDLSSREVKVASHIESTEQQQQLATVENQVMHPTNPNLRDATSQQKTVDKPTSKWARRNRIKEKTGFRFHTRTPSPDPSYCNEKDETASTETGVTTSPMMMTRDSVFESRRSESLSPHPLPVRFTQKTGYLFQAGSTSLTPPRCTKEESHTFVDEKVSDCFDGAVSMTGGRTISKSLSPMPRLSRLKQKSTYAFLNSRGPSSSQSPAQSSTVQVTVKNERTVKPNTKDDSLYPITRLHRLKQLPGFDKLRARSTSPLAPSLETELETVVSKKDKKPEPGNVIKPPPRSESLSPVRVRKAFDPIGSRSPPLPRPKGSSSLSPIPRPKALRPIKSEGPARDPPARLQMPDISTSPRRNEADAPRDPDAKTPRGSSPRAGFGFAFDEVESKMSDGKTAQSENGATTDESSFHVETPLKIPSAGRFVSEVLAKEMECCSSPGNSLLPTGSPEMPSGNCVRGVVDEEIEDMKPSYTDSPAKTPDRLLSQSSNHGKGKPNLLVASFIGDRADMNTESRSEADNRLMLDVDTKVVDFATAKCYIDVDEHPAGEDVATAEKIATEELRDTIGPDLGRVVTETAEATYDAKSKNRYISSTETSESDEQLRTYEEEEDSKRDCKSSESHDHDDNVVPGDLEEKLSEAHLHDCLYNEYLLSADTGDGLSPHHSGETPQENEFEKRLDLPFASARLEGFFAYNIDGEDDSQCRDSTRVDTLIGADTSIVIGASTEDEVLQHAFSSTSVIDRDHSCQGGPRSNEEGDFAGCETNLFRTNANNDSIREVEHKACNTVHSGLEHDQIDSMIHQSDKKEKGTNIIQYESFAAMKGNFESAASASCDSCSHEGSDAGSNDADLVAVDPPKGKEQAMGEIGITSRFFLEESTQAETAEASKDDFTGSDHMTTFTMQNSKSAEMRSQTLAEFDARKWQSGQINNSEGADQLPVQNDNEQPCNSHEISGVNLAKLRQVAESSSMFDDTSSVANTESTFAAADGTVMTVRRTDLAEIRKIVQTTAGLGSVEEGPEHSPRVTSEETRGDHVVSGQGNRVTPFESVPPPPPPPLPQIETASQLQTDLTREEIIVQQAHFLLMPPPPPPQGKKVRKKKRPMKEKTSRVANHEVYSTTESKLEDLSENSEEEDLKIFIDSLDRDDTKNSDADIDETEMPQNFALNAAKKDADNVDGVETVGSNNPSISPRRRPTIGCSESCLHEATVPGEEYFHVPSPKHETSSLPAERNDFIEGSCETTLQPRRANVVSSGMIDKASRVISPVSSSKILHDSKLAEKVDAAISIAAERLEKRVPDSTEYPVNKPGSIVELPIEPCGSPIKLQRSTRFEADETARCKRNSSKRYVTPEGWPSPFEAIVYLKPIVIGQILDFLGGKFSDYLPSFCRLQGRCKSNPVSDLKILLRYVV